MTGIYIHVTVQGRYDCRQLQIKLRSNYRNTCIMCVKRIKRNSKLNIAVGPASAVISCWLLFFPKDLKTTKPVWHLLLIPVLLIQCEHNQVCSYLSGFEGRQEKYHERKIMIFISIRTILAPCNLS